MIEWVTILNKTFATVTAFFDKKKISKWRNLSRVVVARV